MFQWSQQIGVVCSRERCCVLPASIGNHRLVYCEDFGIWSHVNRVAHPEIRNNDFPKVVIGFFIFSFALFSEDRKSLLFLALLVFIYRSQTQHIATQALQALAKVQHVRLCCKLAGFCCKGFDRLCSLVSIHREALRAVLRPANTCMETMQLEDAQLTERQLEKNTQDVVIIETDRPFINQFIIFSWYFYFSFKTLFGSLY